MLNSIDHHAYVIAGSRDTLVPIFLEEFENKFGIAINGNPDFSLIHFESFGIDESRKIKEMQSMKSVGSSKRIFMISTSSITLQAQNAMLKMFEEPTENTHFFIILPSTSFLIDTLLSRVVVIENNFGDKGDKILEAKNFLKITHPERLKMIEKFLKVYKDNKEGKSVVNYFFGEIEVLLAKDMKKNINALEEVLQIKKYIFDTSSSLKILLETLALTLPIF